MNNTLIPCYAIDTRITFRAARRAIIYYGVDSNGFSFYLNHTTIW